MNLYQRIEALEKAVSELEAKQPYEKPTAGYVEIEDVDEMKAFLKRLDKTRVLWKSGSKPSELYPDLNTVGFNVSVKGLTKGWNPELGKPMTQEEFMAFLADNGYPEKPWEPTPNDGHLYAFWYTKTVWLGTYVGTSLSEEEYTHENKRSFGGGHCAQIPKGTPAEELIDLTPEKIKEKGWNWV